LRHRSAYCLAAAPRRIYSSATTSELPISSYENGGKLMTQRPLDHDPTPSAPFAAAGSESTQEYRTQPYLEGSTREDGSGSTEGQSTKDKAQQVAGTAKGEAKNVAGT